MSERALIARLQRLLAQPSSAVEVGIGDDAAVLRTSGKLVWTTDTAVAGVHFRYAWLSFEDIGYRSFQAALSDVAAMAGTPLAATSSLIIPATLSAAALAKLVKGQARAARELNCPVVGGNVSRGQELSVTTSVLGKVLTPRLRSGARPGDQVWLVGDVGLAGAGWRLLSEQTEGRPLRAPLSKRAERACVAAWRRPAALCARGRALGSRAHALIDVSDGLASEARHIATASRCRVVLDERRLLEHLRPELLLAATSLGLDAVELALTGGEDYALLATGPAARRPRWAHVIGYVARGSGALLQRASGKLRPLPTAYDHLALKPARS